MLVVALNSHSVAAGKLTCAPKSSFPSPFQTSTSPREIGYLPVTPGGANLFFQLVNARYEKGAMILTSNRGFAEWGEVFGDPVVATALLDVPIVASRRPVRVCTSAETRALPIQNA